MRRIILASCLAVLASLAGCSYFPPVVGSGNPVTLTYAIEDFTAIQASQTFTVRVVPDTAYSLSVTFDDNLSPYMVVEKRGDATLVLGLEDGYSYQNITLTAVVHVPSLTTLDASGASSIVVESGFSSLATLSIALSGASGCQAVDILCDSLAVDVSGASSVTVTGTAGSVSSHVSGASTAHLTDCPTAFADVELSGASQGWVNAPAGTINVTASGASTLYYAGSPSFGSQDLSGASRIVSLD